MCRRSRRVNKFDNRDLVKMAMQWKVYQRIQATARFATLLALCFVMLPAHAERVRELASFAGVRDNQLVGYTLDGSFNNSRR